MHVKKNIGSFAVSKLLIFHKKGTFFRGPIISKDIFFRQHYTFYTIRAIWVLLNSDPCKESFFSGNMNPNNSGFWKCFYYFKVYLNLGYDIGAKIRIKGLFFE